jgi:hypothetical protein
MQYLVSVWKVSPYGTAGVFIISSITYTKCSCFFKKYTFPMTLADLCLSYIKKERFTQWIAYRHLTLNITSGNPFCGPVSNFSIYIFSTGNYILDIPVIDPTFSQNELESSPKMSANSIYAGTATSASTLATSK